MDLLIRSADIGDLPDLRRIFRDAVEVLGPSVYSSAQVAAWAAFADETEFEGFILGANTSVAEIGAEIVGFCGIEDNGHITSVYVRPELSRRGIATRLLRFVMDRSGRPGSGRYHAEASLFSLPLFRRCGFQQVGTESVVRAGVAFERFLVERVAGDDGIG